MKDSGKPRHTPLLNDLEELKNVLGDEAEKMRHIPVLEDILEPSPTFKPATDCSSNDRADDLKSAPLAEDDIPPISHRDDDDYSREVFIQALIDDLLPDIEAELRRRLLKLDSQILARWHQQSRG